jgi:hypothetical protein
MIIAASQLPWIVMGEEAAFSSSTLPPSEKKKQKWKENRSRMTSRISDPIFCVYYFTLDFPSLE